MSPSTLDLIHVLYHHRMDIALIPTYQRSYKQQRLLKVNYSIKSMAKAHHMLTTYIKIWKQYMESNMFSSEHIQYELPTITSEHPYSEDQFERNFQAKISPSDQSFEKNNKNWES